MSRERQFSEHEVVDRAADVFTTHGYGGTSVAMLVEATCLGRQSLYNSFGDKRDLYLKAVERAVERFAAVQAAMRDAPDGRRAIDAFFAHLVACCASEDPARRHCIVSAGLLECTGDPGIDAVLRDKWGATRTMLRAALARGRRDGSIVAGERAGDLADLLMATMSGLRVAANAGMGEARMRRIVASVLARLDAPSAGAG